MGTVLDSLKEVIRAYGSQDDGHSGIMDKAIEQARIVLKEYEMGTKNNPGKYDCYDKALPDEPLFVLLARDTSSPDLVDEWASKRLLDINIGIRPLTDLLLVEEARKCASDMREWIKSNDGKWREIKCRIQSG